MAGLGVGQIDRRAPFLLRALRSPAIDQIADILGSLSRPEKSFLIPIFPILCILGGHESDFMVMF